jgi:hypothetical protein
LTLGLALSASVCVAIGDQADQCAFLKSLTRRVVA